MLTGHGHYVMCAQFHPAKNILVSASLDQTLRLWDFTHLRKKYESCSAQGAMVGQFEVDTISVLEGHDRGVNWCVFHPTKNMIFSAADDKKIKIWKFSDSKAWESDTLYGHAHNVSCVIFNKNLNVLISNGEDKTIRVWDLDSRSLVETFKKENERYWILSAHPKQNLFAAGSDIGAVLFNL